MVLSLKAAALSWLSLALAARQVVAVETCNDLITAVGANTGTITLEADFDCTGHIQIDTSQEITIEGGGFTINIAAGFSGNTGDSGGSLFVNEGTLTLNGITFTTSAGDSNRVVWNTGTLSMIDCDVSLSATGGFLTKGGVIYSDSSEEIVISGSAFSSNVVTENGGAIYAAGSESLTITGSEFRNNEAGPVEAELGAGGDIYAGRNVDLTIVDTTFRGSAAEFGGAAIECCGADISNSTFTNTDSSSSSEHFGAVLVGRRGEEACTKTFSLTDTKFTGCSVGSDVGAGGSLAIFDTSATIVDCEFEFSVGTALLFESSSSTGEYLLEMETVQFNENLLPSENYAADFPQGTAVVLVNSAVTDDETALMGSFTGTYCFANVPYECEFVYDGAEITHEGEFKCQLCNIDGERQASGADDDFVSETDRSADSSSSDNSGVIIGLSLALGLTLVAIGALAVWKFKVRKNARRLMEDMGESDL